MDKERLGLAVVPVAAAGWSVADMQAVAREAEAAGFESIFTTEVNNDAMATAQVLGAATERIKVGTWIANVYLRHPYVCAQGASLISALTGGRFILGLGVSHQPVNGALKVDMSNAAQDVKRYTTEVQAWLRGEGPATHLPQMPAAYKVPVYVAAVTSRMVEQAAEVADGIMPIFWSSERVRKSKAWIERGRSKAASDLGPCDLTLGIPTFVGDDIDALRETARQNLAIYTHFPFFQHLFRASGFTAEASKMEQGAGAESLSNELLDSICLIGPLDRCKQRIAEYRDAGVDLPILMAPLGVAGAREVISALGTAVAA
jgi:alkanesulfonate monooxygenase SsuD/methylene tetrahydromethanopterin reductase-like flavin-dependent oxidoreductase (luciferase family)